ncbi:MAG: elongation factor Ts [Alphaproteobacteria bacterium]|nr:elongation factor Ts [Alphaproteobacteria bacterium]
MAEISAQLVKELRERTGAGMMDCKKALAETAGKLDAAADWLRKKGLAAAAKKAGRVAAEGLVAVAAKDQAAVVEVNAETDFVARNEAFQKFARDVADIALTKKGDLEAIKATAYPGTGRTVAEELTHLVATIGENMSLRRTAMIGGATCVATYVHGALGPGIGRIGVIVGLDSSGDRNQVVAFGKQLAMHIAAARPLATTSAELDPAAIDRERNILADQARQSGKPDNIIAKMVEGRLRKFYEEVVLLEQVFVIDGETKVAKALESAGKAAGGTIKVTGFVRYELGEGIAKQETDFAAEVAAAAR